MSPDELAARRYCDNGHDLMDPRNLYPYRGRGRRCKPCMVEANELRSKAYKALGITQRDYLALHGSSKYTALKILRELGAA